MNKIIINGVINSDSGRAIDVGPPSHTHFIVGSATEEMKVWMVFLFVFAVTLLCV